MQSHPEILIDRFAPNLVVAVVSLYLMFSPVWSPHVAPRMYDNSRVLEIALLVILSTTLLLPKIASATVSFWEGLGRTTHWLILVFLVGGTLSAIASDSTQLGVLQMGLMAQLVLLFLLTGVAARRAGKDGEIVLAVAIACGAGLLVLKFWIAFVQMYVEGRPFSWVSPFLDFANVRFFGQYQAYALLLITLPIKPLRLTGSWRAIVYLIAANFWALQWMVGSRAVWAGFAAAVILIAVFMRSGRNRWVLEQGAIAVAGGTLYLLFATFLLSTPNATPIPVINSIIERGEESSSVRITLAKAAIGMMVESPLTGVGPGQFGLHYSATNAAHPHNTPLQLVAEYGLIAGMAGVALGVVLVVFAVRQLRSISSREPDVTTASLAAALVMGLVDSLFSGNLVMSHSQVLFCVIAGWIVGRADPGNQPIASPRRRQRLQTGLVGLAMLAMLTTTILTVEYLDVIRDMPYPPALRIPSFWQYGRFIDW
jgi:O-antigen ligase